MMINNMRLYQNVLQKVSLTHSLSNSHTIEKDTGFEKKSGGGAAVERRSLGNKYVSSARSTKEFKNLSRDLSTRSLTLSLLAAAALCVR